MIDTDLRLFGNDGLGVQRHAAAGKLQHAEIVGAVADGDHIRRRDAEPFRNVDKRIDLRLSAEDRTGHVAGQCPILFEELVGTIFVKAEFPFPLS